MKLVLALLIYSTHHIKCAQCLCRLLWSNYSIIVFFSRQNKIFSHSIILAFAVTLSWMLTVYANTPTKILPAWVAV